MATFALSIAKGMPTLVKYICYMILMVCALGWAKPQEEKATPHRAMPFGEYTECIQAEEPAAAKTMAHLYDERTAIPVQAAPKGARTSVHSFKPKCMGTTTGSHQPDIKTYEASNTPQFLQQPHFYTIDYYIYTLGHILI